MRPGPIVPAVAVALEDARPVPPLPWCESPAVASSWRMVGGRACRLDRHWERFWRWLADADAAPAAVIRRRIRTRIELTIPSDGQWFPRIEWRPEAAAVQCWSRPAPPRGGPVRLWTGAGADTRVDPTRKGPDLGTLLALRERARAAGDDDAALLDRDGHLLETATASIVWWEGRVLCTAPDGLVLPGVTREAVLSAARRHGIAVERRLRRPEHLRTRRVLTLNALHGVRRVTAIGGVPLTGSDAPAVRAVR